MENLLEIYEDDNKSWSVYGPKPKELDNKIWSGAIEHEVKNEFIDFFDISRLEPKAQEKYYREKEIIFKSLKVLLFSTCPTATIGKSGQIYLFYPVGEHSGFAYTMADGEFGFVGAGTVCIITPKNENVLYIFHQKLGSDIYNVNEISIGKIDKAINTNNWISIKNIEL